ncbi:MAG: Glycosyl transferase, group 1 [Candidatus Daviesbacteria bacterium GW2011_GWB1_36_5]|uniref:Glycosyl transferase, group 1 n=1 Tax=Candidatus Daviesbacteria bacterium GW2011_GWB1_36_5 TaxID=1618426 RepID=A0A0G0HWN2_9BACT|nr:MAG: Glycosyl transferase, group 1 [Candidatus Daviesbacteria bacterium GW2011_GWB1_36_5]
MKLGLALSIGESFTDLKLHGQDVLVRDQNVKAYSQEFEKVYVFSYGNEKYPLFKNNRLAVNKHGIHRYIYAFLMPIIHSKEFKDCDVLRGFQTTGGIPCVVAKLLFGTPFVVNYGYDYESIAKIEGSLIKSFFYKIVNLIVLKTANTVIVTNPAFIKKIKEIGAKSVVLIPNSVDTALFIPKKKITTSKIKEIVFIGRLEPQKNIVKLLKALVKIKYPYRLKIIGRGSQKKYLQKYAQNYKLNVTFTDSVAHDKLPAVLQSADLYVLPSLLEGHPKSLLEAMSTGVPCLGTDVEGINDLLQNEKTGILVGTESADIKSGIEKILSDPKLASKIGSNAREFTKAHFNASILLSKEIKLLKSQAK